MTARKREAAGSADDVTSPASDYQRCDLLPKNCAKFHSRRTAAAACARRAVIKNGNTESVPQARDSRFCPIEAIGVMDRPRSAALRTNAGRLVKVRIYARSAAVPYRLYLPGAELYARRQEAQGLKGDLQPLGIRLNACGSQPGDWVVTATPVDRARIVSLR